jgi:benzil reductase ((S)-benzoin forming)
MDVYIITGASRGLGEALAKKLLAKTNVLFCVSRTDNPALRQMAEARECPLRCIAYDLREVEGLEELMRGIFAEIALLHPVHGITLINNAGMLQPVKRLENATASELIGNLQVNLAAPMVLSALFARFSRQLSVQHRMIVNISSGAGKYPYYGWAAYCASKAGMDMFTRVMGLEESAQPLPVKVVSIAPGVVDTAMQEEIRKASREDFIQVDRFRELKESGSLLNPDAAAEKILEIVARPDVNNGSVLDVRDFL